MKKSILASITLFAALASPAVCLADLEPIEESGLGQVTGEGIAILPENFRIVFDSNAYIRTKPRGAPVAGSAADMFWYGFAFTGADGNLNNRVGASAITSWGTFSNPWVFLATSPSNVLYNGTTNNHPVLQYRAPAYRNAADFTSASVMNLKYAFFGDIFICGAGRPGYGGTNVCGIGDTGATIAGVTNRLQSISVWDGFSFHGSKYSIFQTTVDYGKYMGAAGTEFLAVTGAGATSDGTFGAVWLNRINSNTTGKLRFGVGGSTGTASVTSAVPEANSLSFNANEGVWLTNVDINMPVGHLHYQPIIFDNDASGNLIIEVVRIPNTANVYNYAYRDYSVADGSDDPAVNANKMCTNSSRSCENATHGQVSVGSMEFRDIAGAVTVASGGAAGTPASVLIDGVLIQHLKIRTLGL